MIDVLNDISKVEGQKDGSELSGPLLPIGVVLTNLAEIHQWEMGRSWLQKLVYGGRPKTGKNRTIAPAQAKVVLRVIYPRMIKRITSSKQPYPIQRR